MLTTGTFDASVCVVGGGPGSFMAAAGLGVTGSVEEKKCCFEVAYTAIGVLAPKSRQTMGTSTHAVRS